MSKHGSARAILAGAAIVAMAGCALAGCSGVPAGTRPDVPGPGGNTGPTAGSSNAANATSQGSGMAPAATQQGAPAEGFARANSIPFPVAVGNTWIYQTSAGGQTGRTTSKIVGAGPGSAGYLVTVSSTTALGGSASTVVPVYTFYPDVTIGYPVPPVSGVPLTGGSIRWPDAAGLDRAGHWPGEDRSADPRARRDRAHHERAAVLQQGGQRRGRRQLNVGGTGPAGRVTGPVRDEGCC